MRQFITTELLILVMWSGPLRGLLGPGEVLILGP